MIGYNNCKYRVGKSFVNKDGKRIEYMRCKKDRKSCRLDDMFGYSCFELRERDEVKNG